MKFLKQLLLLVGLLVLASENGSLAATNSPPPVTALDFYNTGYQLLTEKQFAEAERMFQSALATRNEAILPKALFNLGYTRYAAGLEKLKKGPEARSTSAQNEALLAKGEGIMAGGEAALAQNNLDKMIAAYIAGRGQQKSLKQAEKAVKTALDAYAVTLAKWQQSADDFHGVVELNSADTNALRNAELVQRELAKLIDSIRLMQPMAGMLGKQKQDLGKLLSKLKGQIPAANAPPGAAGEDGEEEEGGEKPDSLAGKSEKAGSEGQAAATPISPDQAGKILDGISVDGSRRLSMSDKKGTPPKDKNGRNW